jgi:predicted NBD/HSP70 family sugar kinase
MLSKQEENRMLVEEPQWLIGVSAGLNTIHTMLVREEVNGRLRLMGEYRKRRVAERPGEELLLERVCESIEKAIEDAQVSPEEILAIGVASPGLVDSENGLVLFSPLFEVEDAPFPFVEKLRERISVEHITLINNDNAQGIGEQRIGEGRDVADLVYLRIGYNIGSSIIINGKVCTGEDNLAGAFGHMSIDPRGPECPCGNRGCLDVMASREAIKRKLKEMSRDGRATILANDLRKEPLDINSAIIADALDQEDRLTREVVEEAADMLGIGIANVINLLNPQRIILGGDVADEIDLFFEKAVASALGRSLPDSRKNLSIVRGRLGTTASAYGAAVFAKERLLGVH